jgi:hypothetical protein
MGSKRGADGSYQMAGRRGVLLAFVRHADHFWLEGCGLSYQRRLETPRAELPWLANGSLSPGL